MTKTQDVVDHIGRTELPVPAQPVLHRRSEVTRADWAAYNGDFLHKSWRQVREEAQGYLVLDKATFADWEDFCWRLSAKHAPERYTQWSLWMDS